VNWRALGCGLLAITVFVALGLVALNLAISRVVCPDRLRAGPDVYRSVGEPTSEPRIPGEDVELERIGTTLIGVDSRGVFVLPHDAPQDSLAQTPDRFALDCGDGTFQAYALEGG
jgi:hypothetical protein